LLRIEEYDLFFFKTKKRKKVGAFAQVFRDTSTLILEILRIGLDGFFGLDWAVSFGLDWAVSFGFLD